MQSRTSFFNAAVFRKTVSRFWPIWGAYLGAGILALPLVLLANDYTYRQSPNRLAEYLLNMSHFGGLTMSALFGLFMAMAVWSFLHSPRAAYGMACLPLRRENVFVSAMMGGIVPLLCANAVVYALTFAVSACIGVPAPGTAAQGFAIASLQLLFFFGFATFCALLTGNILALPAVYVVLNFVFVGMEVLVRYILSLFVYGLHGSVDAMRLRWLSPVVAICTDCGCRSEAQWRGDVYEVLEPAHFSGWGVLLAYALAGLVFLALALLLLRRRRMETAGDVVAIGILKPIFRWCMAVGSAASVGCLLFLLFLEAPARAQGLSQGAALLCMIGFMLLGAFLGWFAGEMLIKKSFRVFRSRWGGLALCWALIAALMLACELDAFGFERYVPDADRVKSVRMVTLYGDAAVLRAPENIDAACALHERIVSEKSANEQMEKAQSRGEYYASIYLVMTYSMTGGRTVEREYELFYAPDAADYGAAGETQALMNCTEAILSRKETEIPIRADTVDYASVSMPMTAAECAAAAGYDSAEDYVLREIKGLPHNVIAAMTESERRSAVTEAVNCDSYSFRLCDPYAADTDDVLAEAYPGVYTDEKWTPETGCPLEDVLFYYELSLTPAEAAALYSECIVPDFADGTLGRIWYIMDEEYYETVSCGEIFIQMHRSAAGTDDHGYSSFRTVPTVNAVRTGAYLAERGIVLHTEGELGRG